MNIERRAGQSQPDEVLLQRAGRIRLLACDLDGSLLNTQKQISPLTLTRIQQAAAKGIRTTICSGRIYPMLELYARQLQSDTPLICVNGGMLVAADGRELRGIPMAATDAYLSLAFALRHNIDCGVLCDDVSYFSHDSVRVKRFEQYNALAEKEALHSIVLRKMEALPEGVIPDAAWVREHYPQFAFAKIRKIIFFERNDGEIERASQFLRENTALNFSHSDPGLLDIVPAGVDKGSGLRMLADYLGLTAEQVMVFGDFDNDLPMFEWAGFSVAMGNAEAELKVRATAVTDTNDAEGVARAIERYILAER